MKKIVLLPILFTGIIMSTQVSAQSYLDQNITSVISESTNYTNDGYVEIAASDGIEYRASTKDHSIKQITHTMNGARIDGATCGSEFVESNMSYKLIHDWNHGNERYRTYSAPDGEVLMVTTRSNVVISLTEYSKSIANC